MTRREMGSEKTHLKLTLGDEQDASIDVAAFGKAQEITVQTGGIVNVWCQLDINERNGRRSVQGKFLFFKA